MKKASILFSLFVTTIVYAGVLINGQPHFTGTVNTEGSSVNVNGDITKTSNGITSEVVTQTTENITLYVRSTGDDDNDCLSIGNACLTIQEAVDRVPSRLLHIATVDVGPGTFAGIFIQGYDSIGGKLIIDGTLEQTTPATGTATGTATGGSVTQCVDSGQSWTTNDLRGKLMLVNSEYRVIRENNGTTVELVGPLSATCSGESYQIVEQTTIINDTGPGGFGQIDGRNCSQTARDSFKIQDVKVTGGVVGIYSIYEAPFYVERVYQSGATYGIAFQATDGLLGFHDVYVTGDYYGLVLISNASTVSQTVGTRFFAYNNTAYGVFIDHEISACAFDYFYVENNGSHGVYVGYSADTIGFIGYFYAYNNGGDGFYAWSAKELDFGDVYIASNTGNGIRLAGTPFADVDSGTITGNGAYGVYLDDSSTGNRVVFSMINLSGNITISNNTSGGVIALNHSVVAMTNVDGSGNGGYGVNVQTRSYATVTSDTGITGSSGDATIDKGTTALSWSVEFAGDGDSVVNVDTMAGIERKD